MNTQKRHEARAKYEKTQADKKAKRLGLKPTKVQKKKGR